MFCGADWSDPPVDPSKYYGRKIESIGFSTQRFVLRFTDGTIIALCDNASYCCEHRHMTCDDDVSVLIGGSLTGIEMKEGPVVEDPDDYNVHDICFVEVRTDKGFITLANHNEHNGYYGGFELAIEEGSPDDV